MKFDATVLADDELVVLESTLRVQLEVAKHVRLQQVTGAIGAAILTGGFSALLSGPSIICSSVLRKKCRRRHRVCCREMFLRCLAVAPVDKVQYAKRALALSVASGLSCCVLGFALDLMVDEAVLQVLSFFFSMVVEGRVTRGTTAFVHGQAADLVGRQDVFVLNDEPAMLFGGISASSSTHQKQTKRARVKSFIVGKPKQMWKAASWSFSTTEVQSKLRGAQQKCRRSNTSVGFHESSSNGESSDSFAEWALLFSNERSVHYQQQHDHGSGQAQDGPETLFGCRFRTAARGQDGGHAARSLGAEEEHVDLVRSDAFTLFGPPWTRLLHRAAASLMLAK
uniref:Uncharacterized protein n=1 Tax=Globisporangium ultimum (strain ATCC 200006 / CBS 805.95 / DAOM BR144) TaxID=431595 RepID=K3X3Q1_GLOUD